MNTRTTETIFCNTHGPIQNKCPSLALPKELDITDTPEDPTSTALGSTIGVLNILKEAAGIAPVPFLKGAISTVLILLETVRVCAPDGHQANR